MLKTISTLVSLVAAALIALPTSAGDFGKNSFSRHGGKGFIRHHAPTIVGRPFRGWNDGRIRFSDGYGQFGYRHGRTPLIKRASWPNAGYNGYRGYGGGYGGYGGRNVIVLVAPQLGGGNASGTYAGSSYVYDNDGGTYAVGSGYGLPAPTRTTTLAPMAKVINVTAKSSSCSYEAGVCVIRP